MGLLDKLGGGHVGGGHHNKFRQIFEMAKPVLNLSDDQERQAKEIFRDFREDRQDIKEAGDKDGDGNLQHEMKDARQDAKEKILALLTPEQKKLFDENIQKWRGMVE